MKRMIALVTACALSACGQQTVVDADTAFADHSAPHEPVATSILNAGVMAQLGVADAQAKFLFDPLYDDHFGTLEPLDEALIERIVNGEEPYDGVTAVFVSHAHGDHFSASQFNRLMAAQGEIQLVAPVQAIDRMRTDAGWDPVFATRITGISLENGEQSQPLEIAGVQIEAFRSPHTGWPDRHADVHNITYRVSAASSSGAYHRVMHFGDADPSRKHFTDHGEFLGAARTGLAIVPYWHFGTANPDALFDETFNAQEAVGMHVPVSPPEWLGKAGRSFFTGEGQTAAIPETP